MSQGQVSALGLRAVGIRITEILGSHSGFRAPPTQAGQTLGLGPGGFSEYTTPSPSWSAVSVDKFCTGRE